MLDLKFIRENTKVTEKAIKNRGMKVDIKSLLELDSERRFFLSESEQLKHRRNIESEEIGKLLKEKKDAKDRINTMKAVSQKIKDMNKKIADISQKIQDLLYTIPNIPDSSVPVGPDKDSNKIVRKWGKSPKLSFKGRNHMELAELLGIIDYPRASKLSGAGFALFKGMGAKLERSLINFMLDLHTKKHGYTEVLPPYLVNRASMTGTGQLPNLEADMYRLKDDDLFLIPTAEVPITNMHRDEILDGEGMPVYYTAYTACFRREAGSYGKETQGLTRVHQFDKVELVKFVEPKTSDKELDKLLNDAEEVIKQLQLPYKIVLLSTGDISFAACKCYDIELWAPVSGVFLETSSCSNFSDFQARRTNIKYRPKNSKKTEYVHTLNGSGVALARLVISILENYQNKDGSVNIPEVLKPYMGGIEKIEP